MSKFAEYKNWFKKQPLGDKLLMAGFAAAVTAGLGLAANHHIFNPPSPEEMAAREARDQTTAQILRHKTID